MLTPNIRADSKNVPSKVRTERECWRIVAGFERYEVSNLGRLRRRSTGRMLKPSLNSYASNGQYLRVQLWSLSGMRRAFYVHRLVAAAFVAGRSAERWQVDHIDGHTLNNRADNLAWTTPRENVRRRDRRLRRKATQWAEDGYSKWLRGEPGGIPF